MSAGVLHCDVCKARVSKRSALEAVQYRIQRGQPERSGSWFEAVVRGVVVRACRFACTEKYDHARQHPHAGWTFVIDRSASGKAAAC